MVLSRRRLVLEVASSGHHTLLVGATDFIVDGTATGHNDDAARAPLLPLLAALGDLPSALGSDRIWCCPAAVGGPFTLPKMKAGPAASS
jgi:hypothetical protein